MRRRTRVALAVTLGAVPVIVLAWPWVTGTADVLNPGILREARSEIVRHWLVILGAGLVASAVVAVLLSFARGPVGSTAAAVAIVATVLASPIPIYWYTYRDTPKGLHINIPASERYAAPLACVVAAMVYPALGLVRRPSRGQPHAPSA